MNTLQIIKSSPKFDGKNFVEWRKSFIDILKIYWPYLSKIVGGLKKTEPILREGIRELEDPIESSGYDTGNIGERERSNVEDIKAWDSTNEHFFHGCSPKRIITI